MALTEFQCAAADDSGFYAPHRLLEMAQLLKEGLPTGTIVHVPDDAPKFGARSIHVFEPTIFSIHVTVPVWQPNLTWDSVRVYDARKNRGIWSTFSRNLIALAHASGRSCITGQASWENGGYAMARGRFAISDYAWTSLKPALQTRLDALAPMVEAHAENGIEAVSRARRLVNSYHTSSLWELADLDYDCRDAFNVAARARLDDAFYSSFRNTDLDEGDTWDRHGMAATILRGSARPTLGWALLTRTEYPAVIRLNDTTHCAVLEARYEGLAPLAAKMRGFRVP